MHTHMYLLYYARVILMLKRLLSPSILHSFYVDVRSVT